MLPALSKKRATHSGSSCFALVVCGSFPETLRKVVQLVKLDSLCTLLCKHDERCRHLVGVTFPHHLPCKDLHCYLHSGVIDAGDLSISHGFFTSLNFSFIDSMITRSPPLPLKIITIFLLIYSRHVIQWINISVMGISSSIHRHQSRTKHSSCLMTKFVSEVWL